MFKWQEDIDHLGIAANKVMRLHQSQNEVQVALPGVPSQEATAYACAFNVKGKLRVTIAFHLKSSQRVAFFFPRNTDGSQPAKELLQDALDYAESMGFSLADTDYHLLTDSQREHLWSELPLNKGIHKEHPEEILDVEDSVPETSFSEDSDGAAAQSSETIPPIEEEIEEEIDEIEITLEEEPPPAASPSAAGTGKELPEPTTEPAPERSPTEIFGRFLSSF